MKIIDISKLESALANAEEVGVLGSPSTNALLNINLLEGAEARNLIGNFCVMNFLQDKKRTISIGQINAITLSNPYLERHSIQKIISVRKQAPPLTGQHDVRLVEMNVGAVYSVESGLLEPATLGSLPATGTTIHLLNKSLMEALLEPYLDDTFFVGRMFNTDYLLPTTFRHFGKNEGGLGEAYHIGVFGKTGSGKSYLAKMILAAYSKRSPMSILIIDPMGEFSKDISDESSPLVQTFRKFGRQFAYYDISRLSLITIESFERLIRVSNFLREMGIAAEENKENALRLLRGILEGRVVEQQRRLAGTEERISLSNCHKRPIFERITYIFSQHINRVYVQQEARDRVVQILQDDQDRLYGLWHALTLLFSTEKRTSVFKILSDVCESNKIVTLNLSENTAGEVYWNESVLAIVLSEIIDQLKGIGGTKFNQGNTLNLLVCTDEAHRFTPKETADNEDFSRLKGLFLDAVKTTRKYGLGWMFISQTLASLDNELLNQLRLYFFGYGLSWGSELRNLREIIGGGRGEGYIDLYQNFKDPQTAALLGKKEYPFMAFGPVSILSVSGAPVFFTALNYFDEFLKLNELAK